MAVGLGRAGLAWGIGLHPARPGPGPRKREGDGRSPAGLFAITELFGEAAPDSDFARAARLPYRRATASLKCVDDPASRHYNRFVDSGAEAGIDWRSHEEMRRDDERYALGAVIAHNADPPRPGAGSCIFLHSREREGLPTAGCTAAAAADLAAICGWLDGSRSPLLIQLPLPEYERLRRPWGLPPAP